MKSISCFLPYQDDTATRSTVRQLTCSPLVEKIYLLVPADKKEPQIPSCASIRTNDLWSSETIRTIAEHSTTEFILIYTQGDALKLGPFALDRLATLASETNAGLLYADYQETKGEKTEPHPLIDYQEGSLRDDFNFGALLLYRAEALIEAITCAHEQYRFAGLYDLRLKVSQSWPITHVSEYLYTIVENDLRTSGEKLFDYVDPKNRAVQLEMEAACTEHLRQVGAYLSPVTREIEFEGTDFPREASVIIPVRNRVRTIEDAIRSALRQATDFNYNVIVVDNHSTDGTTEKIAALAKEDPRLLHLLPERNDLGIGGCWNLAIHHPECGRFAVQLDSDDVYSDEHTLSRVISTFRSEHCAMVIGSYRMTNFQMETLPPGVIDHREWTAENGHNNALRINGLGAPRAFYTPLLRQLNLPNTSYGEDYAIGLRLCREYKIGRIYDVLYLCRRWEDNSDAALDTRRMNDHNLYKDKIRTWELQARILLNKRKA